LEEKIMEMLGMCDSDLERKVVVGMLLEKEDVKTETLKKVKGFYEEIYGKVDYRLVIELDKRGELEKEVGEYAILV